MRLGWPFVNLTAVEREMMQVDELLDKHLVFDELDFPMIPDCEYPLDPLTPVQAAISATYRTKASAEARQAVLRATIDEALNELGQIEIVIEATTAMINVLEAEPVSPTALAIEQGQQVSEQLQNKPVGRKS